MSVEIEQDIINEEEGDLVLSTGSGRVLLNNQGQLELFTTVTKEDGHNGKDGKAGETIYPSYAGGYNAGTIYQKQEFVEYEGYYWLSLIQNNKGNTPSQVAAPRLTTGSAPAGYTQLATAKAIGTFALNTGWGATTASASGYDGIYWNEKTFLEPNAGATLVATTGSKASNERHVAIYLSANLTASAEPLEGYEAAFYEEGATTKYEVRIYKWVAGVQMLLATSSETVTLNLLKRFEFSLQKGVLTASAQGTKAVSATDTAFSGPFRAGLFCKGNAGRMKELEVGNSAWVRLAPAPGSVEQVEGQTARAEAVELEASTTRRTMVQATVTFEKGKGGGIQFWTGSKASPKFAGEAAVAKSNSEVTVESLSFLLGPGEKWFWEKTGEAGTDKEVQTTYFLF